jgi:hypothetical protein
MLDRNRATTRDKPLLVAENSTDLEIILLIITGLGPCVVYRATNWKHAQRLFAIMESYKLYAYHPWFSQICRAHVREEPWEAIFLACNQSPFDKDLIMAAMVEGFRHQPFSLICKPSYYKKTNITGADSECWSALTATNIKPLFGMKLGLRGVMAYHSTFEAISPLPGYKTFPWYSWADKFVRSMSDMEAVYETVRYACKVFAAERHP